MNPATVLALVADLYSQVQVIADENRQLREALEASRASWEEP